jgi:hypothetical protein
MAHGGKDIINRGNDVAHSGAALADATLFLSGPLKPRSSTDEEYVGHYGVSAQTVWNYSTFTKFCEILS